MFAIYFSRYDLLVKHRMHEVAHFGLTTLDYRGSIGLNSNVFSVSD